MTHRIVWSRILVATVPFAVLASLFLFVSTTYYSSRKTYLTERPVEFYLTTIGDRIDQNTARALEAKDTKKEGQGPYRNATIAGKKFTIDTYGAGSVDRPGDYSHVGVTVRIYPDRILNYNLEECMATMPIFNDVSIMAVLYDGSLIMSHSDYTDYYKVSGKIIYSQYRVQCGDAYERLARENDKY